MKNITTKVIILFLFGSILSTKAQQNKSTNTGSVFFQENKGQVCDQNYKTRHDVLFSGSANGINYHLTNSGISYQLNNVDSWEETTDLKTNNQRKIATKTTIYRVDINWLGANPNSKIVKGNELPGVSNFYLEQCRDGALDVKSYEDITYKNIYNGIDLKWYEKIGELEYDFIVKPYADLKQIKIEIKGSEKLSINKKGELEIKTPLGTIIEKAPVAFQNNKQLAACWIVKNNIASFKIDNYDKTQTLIIDPALRKWGTYYGAAADDYGRGCKTDASGNVYLTGQTASNTTTLIATTGSHQSSFGTGTSDAYLAKFNTSGVRQWATYYGGTGIDVGYCVEVDGTNEYIAGYSTSTTIATVGSHQATAGGGNDGFLVKFDQNGVRIWATFYGGNGSDIINACAKDASGNIYVTGNTTSNAAIAISGHQNTYAGGGDAFLVKFNSSGVRQWGTYYGGASVTDNGNGCAVDATGMVYITGDAQTSTGTSIATAGAHQTTFGGGGIDAYLAKFSSAGVRQWGTYYGGSSVDFARGCVTDASNNIFIVGETTSATTTLIATAGSHQTAFGGGSADAFFAKFNSAGVRQWGTYFGTNGADYGLSCTINNNGELLVVGNTNSPSGISTTGAHQINPAGGIEGYLTAMNNNTGQQVWGTYYGSGTGADYSTGICTDNVGYLFMSGYTNFSGSTLAIATANGHQATPGGLNDGFLVKFADCPTLTLSIAASSNTICSGQAATLTANGSGFTGYTWSTGSTNSTISITPSVTTNYSLTAGTSTATCSYDAFFTLTVTPTPTVTISPSSTTLCSGNTVTLTASGASSYSWNTASTNTVITVSPMANTTYTVTGYNGACSNVKTQLIQVTASPTLFASASPNSICSGAPVSLSAGGTANTYTWSTGSNNPNIADFPTVTTTYSVTGHNNLCISNTSTVAVTVTTTPTVTINASAAAICTGGSATLTAGGASSYSWNTTATVSSIVVSPVTSTNYTVTGYNGSCIATKTINVGIATSITVTALSNTTSVCAGSPATITANGASSYTWSTGSNSNSITVNPLVPTTYSVNGVSGSCNGSTTLSINVNPNPTVAVVSTSSLICAGEAATLTANGANTYTWDTGDNTAVITVTPSSTTVYSVTGYNASGCSNLSVFTQSVSACLGVNEIRNAKNISIYPNPTSDKINIETDFDHFDVSVYDVLGKLVFEKKINTSDTNFNIDEFAKGVYTIKLQSDGVSIIKKVIFE